MNCFIYFYSRYVLDLLLNKNVLEGSRNLESSKIFLDLWQGILSVPGIAGYKWVPARIGRFYKDKIFFSYYQRPIKNRKNRYSFVSQHFPCSVFPAYAQLTLVCCVCFGHKADFTYETSSPEKHCFIQKWSQLTLKIKLWFNGEQYLVDSLSKLVVNFLYELFL
jgi:hypothetical protein